MNKMREKLLDLIIDAKQDIPAMECFTEFLADYLIEHGVIVMPCKVLDDVYWIDPENEVVEKQGFGIKAVCYYGDGKFKVIAETDGYPEELHTDWCMLTEEEANKRLLERFKK